MFCSPTLPGDLCNKQCVYDDGLVDCTYCANGTGVADSTITDPHQCKWCPAGQYSPGGMPEPAASRTAVCKACPGGKYAAQNKSGACETCPVGRYASGEGNTECKSCPACTSAAFGATECTACPPGKSAEGGDECTTCELPIYHCCTENPAVGSGCSTAWLNATPDNCCLTAPPPMSYYSNESGNLRWTGFLSNAADKDGCRDYCEDDYIFDNTSCSICYADNCRPAP